jgi:hypothetical protein
MGIEPERDSNEDRSFGFASSFRGYPLPKNASKEYREGHKSYQETRKAELKAMMPNAKSSSKPTL